MTDHTSPPTTAPPDLTKVECGYCGTPDVPVNTRSGDVRAHKRQFAGRKIPCIGSGQRAFVYPGNLEAGDEFNVVGEDAPGARRVVDAKPTIPRDSSLWEVPTGGLVLLMRGDVLLRLWTRQAGER